MHDGDWGTGTWLAMSLMMLLFWGGVIALVVWLVRGTRRTPPGSDEVTGSSAATAEDVLAQRFARGEIDEDEFTRRRAVLRGTSTTA